MESQPRRTRSRRLALRSSFASVITGSVLFLRGTSRGGLGKPLCSRLVQSRGNVGQRIGTSNGQEHHEEIRSRIDDPRAVAGRTQLPALLDDAVKLTRSTAHEIAPA